jgi:heme A synthase
VKSGLRLPDRNARIYRKPNVTLLDVVLATLLLLVWVVVFLGVLTVCLALLKLPGWAALIIAGVCTLVVVALSAVFRPTQRAAEVIFSNLHFNWDYSGGCP